ncbi:MAG: sensor diguanylate cyclase/phosphodiesterase [Gammaproteobacteria bacterium]|nr:sensor diguanylate cyclase/phosphodiesterase [Gammaproteobacteria bacterium]
MGVSTTTREIAEPGLDLELHKKTLIAACLGALALIVVVFSSTRLLLLHSFQTIETAEARQSIERVKQAMQMELLRLATAAVDNGHWDQAFEYVNGRNDNFIRDNFTRDGLDVIRMQVLWIADSNGRTRVSVGTRGTPPGTLLQLAPDLLARIEKYAPALVTGDSAESPVRLMRVPDGVLAFATARILRSNRAGPSPGLMVFGHYFDAEIVRHLEETSQSPVKLILLDEHGAATAAVRDSVARWLAAASAQQHNDIFIQTNGGETLDSYTLLRDVEGRPLAVLANSVSHAALQLGRRTITGVFVALLIGFALLLGVLLAIVNLGWRTRAVAQRQSLDQQRKFSRLARRDVLTGLPNRVYLQKILPRLIKRATRDQSRLALLYVDLDHFKNVNDSLGHEAGDKLLMAVAHRLRAAVSTHDVVVRMGGDEFVIVANMLPNAQVVNSIADRIRRALVVPLDLDGVTMFASPSIGISVYPEDGIDAEQLLKHADIALNHAKDRGRGNHQFYTPEMNARLRERFGLERALRQALERNELTLEYQPSFDLQTLRPVSLEALLRWRTADGTYIPPSRFIPIAEQSGLIVDIGEWVLRTVCLQLSEWQRQHVPLLPVSVNISVRQFEHTQLANVVALLADELGIDASLLHFEITESAAMQNSQQHLGSLQALRNLGSRILIDDFGTGYSSLSYLKHLPIDTLKIDRAFVRDMAVDANDAAIVRAIVGVAKSLGLQLVAEGIETAEQLECLRKLDCECGQGFYFSPPVSAESCRAMLWQLRGPPRAVAESPKLRILAPTT